MTDISRILVVEDQPLLLLELIDQLTERGFHTLSAGNARTAARMLDHNVDALVTDIELGSGPDGLVLARLAARSHPGLPMVIVSGGVRPSSRQLPQGAVFLPKPCRASDIVQALQAQRQSHAA